MIELNLPGCKLSTSAPWTSAPGAVGRMWRLWRGHGLPDVPPATPPAEPVLLPPVSAVPVGTAWAECRVDEAARDAWRDPVQFRRERLPVDSRARRVLDEAARRARWSQALPAGQARGIAMAGPVGAQGAIVACVAEVSGDDAGMPQLQRLVAAVDCGAVIDLDAARHDVMDALREAVSAELGHDDPLAIDVWWVCSEGACGDRAEVAGEAVAPALRNAIDALRLERERACALEEIAVL